MDFLMQTSHSFFGDHSERSNASHLPTMWAARTIDSCYAQIRHRYKTCRSHCEVNAEALL